MSDDYLCTDKDCPKSCEENRLLKIVELKKGSKRMDYLEETDLEVDPAADLALCQPKHRVSAPVNIWRSWLLLSWPQKQTSMYVADRRRFGLAARVAGTGSCCGVRCLRFGRSLTLGPPHVLHSFIKLINHFIHEIEF